EVAVPHVALGQLLVGAAGRAEQVADDHRFEHGPKLDRGRDGGQHFAHGTTSTGISVKPDSRPSLVRERSQPASTAAARCSESASLKLWVAGRTVPGSNTAFVSGTT